MKLTEKLKGFWYLETHLDVEDQGSAFHIGLGFVSRSEQALFRVQTYGTFQWQYYQLGHHIPRAPFTANLHAYTLADQSFGVRGAP